MTRAPSKPQLSLDIRPVRAESSLSAWRNHRSLAFHWAHSTLVRLGGCPGWSESSLGARHFVGFVMLRLKFLLFHYGKSVSSVVDWQTIWWPHVRHDGFIPMMPSRREWHLVADSVFVSLRKPLPTQCLENGFPLKLWFPSKQNTIFSKQFWKQKHCFPEGWRTTYMYWMWHWSPLWVSLWLPTRCLGRCHSGYCLSHEL